MEVRELNQEEVAYIRAVIAYDPDAGVFTWKVTTGQKVAGRAVGWLDKKGYVNLTIYFPKRIESSVAGKNNKYGAKANRIAWLLAYGEAPQKDIDIDHINGNRSDNRISNLRAVSRAANLQNRHNKRNKDGYVATSAMLGVSLVKKAEAAGTRNRWRASITVNGKARNLGHYASEEAAYAVYLEAKRKLHPGNML